MEEITSYRLSSVISRILDNKQAKDITVLNISNVSVLADYFVICNADTTTQVRALTSTTKETIKKMYNRLPIGDEKDLKNRWNLLDYGDVVVHILHTEERETYAIEKFWNHACKIKQEDWLKETEALKNEIF
ncbi:MAG: ribosome silencing factor [Candidatus Gastranaerophilales bacterium]|nr:ribosome silencing factor [Candidatus Gastranaerophilales bacterium]